MPDLTEQLRALVADHDAGKLHSNGFVQATRTLLAAAEGVERDGGYARLWRNRWVSDRTTYWRPTAGDYETARARAESEAADYEQQFDMARERLAAMRDSGEGRE